MDEHWSGKTAFIIASIASAVGIANIWRFPYMVAENGGGSFIIPYLIGVFIFGIPIMVLEFLVGSSLKKSASTIFKKLTGKYNVLTYFPLILQFIIATYYVVITGWILSYFIFSINFFSPIPTFANFTSGLLPIYSTIAVIILLFLVVKAGVKNGLEKLNYYLVPLFLISFTSIIIASLYVFGVEKPLDFYSTINPIFLFNPNVWILAFTQAFFSLGVGFGLMLTYGSYLKSKINVLTSSIIVSVADTLIALFAGLMIFALVFGNGLSLNSGPSLTFNSLPLAINSLPFAKIILPIFFFLLFSAALTSAVSILEVPLTLIEDKLSFNRSKSSVLLFILLIVFTIPSMLSYSVFSISIYGMPFLDFLDKLLIGKFAPFAALITTVALSWGYKDLDKKSLNIMSKFTSKIFLSLVRYVIPMFLLFLFISQFV